MYFFFLSEFSQDRIDDVNIGAGDGLVPSGTKLLPEPMLSQFMRPYGVTKPQQFNPSGTETRLFQN